MKTEARDTTITVESNNHGGRAWIARITGTDPKFGLAREFVHKDDITSAKSNKYRDNQWILDKVEGAVYEYRGIDSSSSGGKDGLWVIRGNELVDTTKADVIERFRREGK